MSHTRTHTRALHDCTLSHGRRALSRNWKAANGRRRIPIGIRGAAAAAAAARKGVDISRAKE